MIPPGIVAAQSRSTPGSYDDAVQSLAPNLVAYWKLAETSGTAATDQQALVDGTYAGSPEFTVPTIVQLDEGGTCIALSGSPGNHVDIPDNTALKTAEGTIVITFQRDTSSTKAIIVAGDASNAAGGFAIEVLSSGAIRAFLRRQSDGAPVVLLGADNNVVVGQAYTLVFKWGAAGLSYSVWGENGLIERLTDTLADGLSGTSAIRVGAWHAGQDRLDGAVGRLVWLDRRIADHEEITLAKPRTIERDPVIVYDGALPYGGLGQGIALHSCAIGNMQYTSHLPQTFPIEKVDSPLAAISWNNRTDAQAGTGYSTGDGGTIVIRIHKATLVNRVVTLGEQIGETNQIIDPVLPESWAAEWAAAGGQGSVPSSFRNFPTLRLTQPLDLAAHGLVVGDFLAFDFVQLDGESGTVSFNNGYCLPWETDPKVTSLYQPFQDFGRTYFSSGNERPAHFPLLLLGYQDGVVKGNGNMGLSGSSSGDQYDLTDTARARQVIPMTMTGRSMKRIAVAWFRRTSDTADNLILELREAGASPGGSSDEGTLLFEGTIPAASVTEGSSFVNHVGAINQTIVEASTAIPLETGKTYYLVARSAGSSTVYSFRKMHRYLNQPPVGLKRPDYMVPGFRGQITDGSGWADALGGSGDLPRNDMPIWMEFA